MMVSFVKQKVLSFIQYLLLIVCLSVDLFVSSLKIFFCVDGFKLFPYFSSSRFKVSCLMLKILIHLKLSFVHLIDTYIFSFFYMKLPTTICWQYFFQCVCYSLVFIKKTASEGIWNFVELIICNLISFLNETILCYNTMLFLLL